MIANVELAEVNQEAEALVVEVYPRPDGRAWVVPLEDLIAALAQASERLRQA
jgi:hypothetical protein